MQPFDLEAPAVVMFSDTPANKPQFSLATLKQVGTVWGLAYRSAEPAVYAAAYHKVQLPFGPGGPGAVYRIDLGTGRVEVAFTVPDAGVDQHDQSLIVDSGAEVGTGRTSLGDIDLNSDGSELFVMNLATRRIYRFALPSGQLLGSFNHGAAAEPWSDSARPFGLAFHEGYVFHGVVNSGEKSLRRSDLSAHVFRSRSDGSDMTQVASFDLTYRRGRVGPVHWAGRLGRWLPATVVSLDWQPWRDGYTGASRGPGTNVLTVYPMPMLTDLAFDATGQMVIGLRDRQSDRMPFYDQARVMRECS